ncbi:hypothetical protein [Ralstonia pseudosolanacearum]|uniref:hypothetical protein n=1 Tax=Ralstonia pseudosolanacearum TaxID=1310165 RepID=UPI00115FC3BA|nr:hypothetical protein [Ralstonia pseudosolanacearum]MCL1622618.1 hypothetical protein [Ralstonia pseudosolanacearum CaRs-Mep]
MTAGVSSVFEEIFLEVKLKKFILLAFVIFLIDPVRPVFSQEAKGVPFIFGGNAFAKDYWEAERLKARIHLSKKAIVYIAPYDHYYPVALDETRLKRVGCEYVVDGSEGASNLIDLLESSGIREASFSLQQFEPREAIYLTLSDSSEISLMFDREYDGQPNILGRVGGKLVVADKNLAIRLYRWAAKQRPVEKCESFISNYR